MYAKRPEFVIITLHVYPKVYHGIECPIPADNVDGAFLSVADLPTVPLSKGLSLIFWGFKSEKERQSLFLEISAMANLNVKTTKNYANFTLKCLLPHSF